MITIAEIGINHNGDISIAKKLIDVAVVAGFDCVKFQKRDIDLAVPEHKKNEMKSTPWGEVTYYDYKKRIEFGREIYRELKEYCQYRIKMFASVWDVNSVDFMTKFTDAVKIPSACINNFDLLKKCRDNFGLVIMSTGMSSEDLIEQAVKAANPDIILHTNSAYPSPYDELNLNYITWLKKKYPDKIIGYSGHEYGLSTTFAAAALGAEVIERHITLSHEMWGSDQKSSVDPVGAIKLIRGLKSIEDSLGGYGERKVYDSELKKLSDLRK